MVTVAAGPDPTLREAELAKAVLSLADTAGIPDSYWRTDSRVMLARETLGVSPGERYSRASLWNTNDLEEGDV